MNPSTWRVGLRNTATHITGDWPSPGEYTTAASPTANSPNKLGRVSSGYFADPSSAAIRRDSSPSRNIAERSASARSPQLVRSDSLIQDTSLGQETHFAPPQMDRPNLTRLSTNSQNLFPPSHDGSDASSSDRSERLSAPRSRSIVNLTSSTLFGIYSPADMENPQNPSEPPTPLGTGAQTPVRTSSIDAGLQRLAFTSLEGRKEIPQNNKLKKKPRRRSMSVRKAPKSQTQVVGELLLRILILGAMGVSYGELIRHLHDSRAIAPVPVDAINRTSWSYIQFWGVAAVLHGFLMPWLDGKWSKPERQEPADWADKDRKHVSIDDEEQESSSSRLSLGTDWNPIVRTIGAFVGVAFAIRKLPWTSTLQVSMTLALVNPFIWFLIDRTTVGFLLSTTLAIAGATSLLVVNPNLVPSPATHADLGRLGIPSDLLPDVLTYESVGVWIWIGSVIFCSCLFFGNIGRRLALGRKSQFVINEPDMR